MIRNTLPSTPILLAMVFALWGCDRPAEETRGAAGEPGTPTPGAGKEAAKPAAAANPSPAAAAQPPAPGSAAAALPGEGMKTLPSGVQFSVLKEGAGAPPPLGSVVKVHLTGWVVGPNRPQQQLRQQQQQQFIDTRATGMPQEYTLTRDALAGLSQPQTLSNKPPLIEGLVQVLLEMKPGEQRKVNVPSNLGYGSKGYLPIVPSRADLNFEVELVSFTPPAGKR